MEKLWGVVAYAIYDVVVGVVVILTCLLVSIGQLECPRLCQGAVQVLQEIVHILNAYTQANQILGHGACRTNLSWDTCV